jgi:hypothetical protein
MYSRSGVYAIKNVVETIKKSTALPTDKNTFRRFSTIEKRSSNEDSSSKTKR